ncbi:MAG: DPP IV N-terminal domain-containing protein [Bacteroidota bacterium]|jgi:dipeptidyl-peptidase-4
MTKSHQLKAAFIALLVIVSTGTFAQKKNLTLDEAVLQQRSTLAPKRLSMLQWVATTNSYSYVDGDKLIVEDITSSTKIEYRLSDINSILKSDKQDTLARWTPVVWKNLNSFEIQTGDNTLTIDLSNKKISNIKTSTLTETAQFPEDGPQGDVAYVIDNNIYIDGKKITTDGNYGLVYGKSVHREEFGIEKGLFWSNKGTQLAFYRMDQSMVADYPIVNWNDKPASEKLIKYPFSGAISHEVTIGIYNKSNGKIKYLKTGLPKDHYLTNIAWSPDDKMIYVAELNRDQNEMNLNCYNATTGDFIKTLFTEKDEKYTEPLHPVQFLPTNANQFIWQSRRDGFNHMYLYDTDGKLIRQLTKGNWEVIDVAGFNKKGDKIYFTSTINSGVNRDFCSTTISSGETTRLTTEDGFHATLFNAETENFIDNFSSLNTPRIIKVVSSQGKDIKTLLTAENPLKDYAIGTTKLFTLKSQLGDDLFCRMVLPVDFDSTKKYPVIVYVYGGPHAQMITNTWLAGGDLWYQYMAEKGYIVFTLDNHGSGNRGKAFEQATFRQLGTIEMMDQLTGVDYLKSLSYVDATRMGVHGWSFGGFMTTSLMTRNPDVFKVGVAGGPVIDWSYYEVMYTERYMDTPEQNPEGYKNNNLLNYVDKLKGKLMLIHGTSDDVVVWQHSLMFVKKAVSKNILLDYFPYPGHLHNVTGKDRVHLMGKISQYFEENL